MFWSVFRQILCRIELKADKDFVVFNSQEKHYFLFSRKKNIKSINANIMLLIVMRNFNDP